MDINKAIKKQKNSYKLSMFIMGFMFLLIPFIVLLTGKTTLFYLVYMTILEVLIILAVIAISNNEILRFKCINNKLKIQVGLFKFTNIILCDKVVLIHTENRKENMEIIIVSDFKIRNKQVRSINKLFNKRYPIAFSALKKIDRLNPQKEYFFVVIKKGGFLKYRLLDIIYKNCVKAFYTDESINNIKIARGQVKIS